MAPWSDKAESGFVLEGLVLVVAEMVGFFLSVPEVVFLEVLLEMGFEGVGLEGFGLEALEVEGLGFGGFVGGILVLSGTVTVSVLVFEGGGAKPSWTVTGITVASRGVGAVPEVGFIV